MPAVHPLPSSDGQCAPSSPLQLLAATTSWTWARPCPRCAAGGSLSAMTPARQLSALPNSPATSRLMISSFFRPQVAKDNKVSLDELVAANDLADPNVVMAGQVIRIPCKPKKR